MVSEPQRKRISTRCGSRLRRGVLAAIAAFALGCSGEHASLVKDLQGAARPELRARAVDRLARMGREDDFPLFLKAAQDPSAMVRKSAAAALAECGELKGIDTLGGLLSDPVAEVQAVAAAGLGRFNTDKSRAYLLNGYGRHEGPTRRAIAAALGPAALAEAVRHEAKMLWERNLKALESGGLAERVGAAEELGRGGRGEAVERLLPLLGNDSLLLAAGAARGLAAARDSRAISPLLGVPREKYPVLREAVVEALGALGDPAAIEVLQRVALEGGPGAVAAVRSLGRLADAPGAKEALCSLTVQAGVDLAPLAASMVGPTGCPLAPLLARAQRGGEDGRAALLAIGAFGVETSLEKPDPVVAMLAAPDARLRLAAARALAGPRAAAAGPALLRRLEERIRALDAALQKWVPADRLTAVNEVAAHPEAANEDDAKARRFRDLMAKVDALAEAKAQALGKRLVDRDPGAPLDVADDVDEVEESTLAALVLAVGRQAPEGALGALSPLASHPRVAIRSAACEALPRLGGREALAASGRCLEDRSLPVARAAVRGLQGAGPAAAPALAAALRQTTRVRAEIAHALGELKAAEAGPALGALLAEGGLEAIEAAVALGRIGDRAHAKPLAEALGRGDGGARVEIIEALAALGAPGCAEVLERELFSERYEVRAAAARALGAMGRQERGGALEALRFDYYAEVRRAAEAALGKGDLAGAR